MWPDIVDGLEETVAAEQALADAYREALNQWAPKARRYVLPVVEGVFNGDPAAATREIAPHPDALTHAQKDWEAAYCDLVEPAVQTLWAAAVVDAITELDVDAQDGAFDDAGREFLAAFRTHALTLPGSVRDDLDALIASEQEALTASINSRLRDAVATAISPGSQLLAKQIRARSYQAAAILNHAAITVGKAHSSNRRRAEAGREPIRKQWVAVLDERTRDTHWAASGQSVELAGNFLVGGVEMEFPGDPKAPAREVVNCRCRIGILREGEKPTRRRAPAGEAKKRRTRGVTVASVSEENDMTTPVQVDAAAPPESETQLYRTFTDAVVAFIGTPTSDRRKFAKDANITYRSMPRPLMWMADTGNGDGHCNAHTVGVIEGMRHDDGKMMASGYLLNTEQADQAAAQLEHKVTRPSVDIGDMEWALTDENDKELTEEDWESLPLDAKVFRTFKAAEMIGVTLVAKPAFGDTYITLNPEREARSEALTAAVLEFTPKVYPASHFEDPHLPGPTLPTIDRETGRAYGHLAEFGHSYRGGNGEAVPRNFNGYANFHTSQVTLDNGKQLSVGRLTVKGGHAATKPSTTVAAARAHYDNVCTTFALVRVGEDEHGIWFSGVPAPGVDPDVFQQGITAPLSGDWRDCGQGVLDMIGVHAVCSPGFPIYSGATGPDGRDVALVASLSPRETQRPELSMADVKTAMKEALREQEFDGRKIAALMKADSITRPKTPNERVSEMLAGRGL